MNNNSTLIWLSIIFIFLIPTPMGRFFIDMAGGIIIFILLMILVFSGLFWLSWRNIKSKLKNCNSCGASYFSELNQCPICGSTEILNSKETENNTPASAATIDIIAEKDE